MQKDPATTQLDGVRLHWRESGNGTPVILLHAFPLNSAQWEPQLADVPPGWRYIAPDLRGFGSSSGSAEDGPYTMDLFADDVVSLMDELGVEKAVICGVSMGGYVAFSILRRHASRVLALVLSDTRAGADSAAAKRGRHTLAEAVGRKGAGAVRDAMLPKMLSPVTLHDRPPVEPTVRAMIEVAPADTLRRTLLGLADRADSEPLLREIRVPTLVLVGSDDAITPHGEAQILARGIRGSRFETIADAGHLPNLERPDAFNRALHTFLDSVEREKAGVRL